VNTNAALKGILEPLLVASMKYPLGYIPEYMGALREYVETKTATGGVTRFRKLVRMMRRHGGRRYPPGYFIYGLDTYKKTVCTVIQCWTPDLLRGVSAYMLHDIQETARHGPSPVPGRQAPDW
jgi:hypothetical protein